MAFQTAQRLWFGPRSRIKQGRDFSRMREGGARLAQGCLVANWQPREAAHTFSRLGVITSSRIGPAVVRNRARRLLREAFRLHQNQLASPVDLVLVARNSIAGKGLAEVEKDYLTVLRKAGLLRREGEGGPGGSPATPDRDANGCAPTDLRG